MDVLALALGLTVGLAVALVVMLVRRRGTGDGSGFAALLDRLGRLESALEASRLDAGATAERTRSLDQAYKDLDAVRTTTAGLPERLARLDTIDHRLAELHGVFRTTTGQGKIGEDAVRAVLAGLPEDLWREQWTVGDGIVDFAVQTQNGSWVPIDSKTGGSDEVGRFLASDERRASLVTDEAVDPTRRLELDRAHADATRRIEDRVRRAGRDLRRYVRPEQGTVPFVVQAIPDAVHAALRPKVRQELAGLGVLPVPYGLLVPLVGAIRRLHAHAEVDVSRVSAVLVRVQDASTRLDETLTNQIERGATMVTNGARAIRTEVEAMRAALASLDGLASGSQDAPATESPPRRGSPGAHNGDWARAVPPS